MKIDVTAMCGYSAPDEPHVRAEARDVVNDIESRPLGEPLVLVS
jgi:hypothetical protein